MAQGPVLYYITDRRAFPGNDEERRRRLLDKVAEAARCGVDHIQLREKDLPARELESLARKAVRAIREATQLRTENRELRTDLLVNSRTDVAIAAGADGVHLRSDDVSPADVRRIWKRGAGDPARAAARDHPIIGVSCHTAADVRRAAENGAHFVVFAPVFEKKDSPTIQPAGLAVLEAACRAGIRVFALGGVTLENARSCLDIGASGIAAIRLFQEDDIASVVRSIRG